MKRATIKDVAARAGVSWKTVSNVMHGRPCVSPDTKDRVMAAVKDLNYIPNFSARDIRGHATRRIGLVIPHLTNPYFARLAEKFHIIANQADYTIEIELSGQHGEIERRYVLGQLSRSIDALIISPTLPDTTKRLVKRDDMPVVLLGEAVTDRGAMHHVSIDNVASAAELTRHLIGKNTQRVVFLGAQHGASSTGSERLIGVVAELDKAQISPDRRLFVSSAEWSREEGYRLTKQLIQSEKSLGKVGDVVIGGNDLLALGAMDAFREQGIRVGETVRVAGWDNIPESESSLPSLTTISPDLDSLARLALFLAVGDDRFLERASYSTVTTVGPGISFVVQHEMIIRESS